MSPVDEGRLPARLDQYTVVPDPTNPALCETCWGVGQVVRAGRPVGCRVCAGTGHASPSGTPAPVAVPGEGPTGAPGAAVVCVLPAAVPHPAVGGRAALRVCRVMPELPLTTPATGAGRRPGPHPLT